jgi:hypothetical protein
LVSLLAPAAAVLLPPYRATHEHVALNRTHRSIAAFYMVLPLFY